MDEEPVLAIFTGTRHHEHTPYQAIWETLRFLPQGSLVYVGDARGVDNAVCVGCEFLGITYTRFKADWSHGDGGGPSRNTRMVDEAAATARATGHKLFCYAFPSPQSRGTWDCVRKAAVAGAEIIK